MSKISIVMFYNDKLDHSDNDLNETIQSLINQNYKNWELLIIDMRGANAPYPKISRHANIHHLPVNFANHALALNHAITQAAGDYIMLANNLQSPITFRLSTLETFWAVAQRHPDLGMIYSDYCLIDEEGKKKDIHLLDHHAGRVRDNMDFGLVWFFPRHVLDHVQGLNGKYQAAYLYDLRLKVSEKFKLVHIAAAKNGYTYLVKATEKKQNVFDYLLAGKQIQLEMEDAVTEHLKRIGAYLTPGANYHRVKYTQEEEKKFSDCIASVVIPVFDREEFIGTAIDSVQAQTIKNVEVIVVVNGGPDDATINGVKPYLPGGKKYDPDKPQVKLLVEDINNLGHCLNKGLREARGKYYVQLDSDDRLKPDAIEKILEVFESDDRIGMVIGSYEVWNKDAVTGEITRDEKVKVVTHDEWTEENGRNNLLRINGAGAPRSAHIKVIRELGWFGMNDGEYSRNYGEDYDLVLRTSEQYRIGRVWDPIYDVIRHVGGTDHSIDQSTVDRNDNAKDFMRLEAIRRRKKINPKNQKTNLK
jgi:glycosyltransferase involved in cell wall biosynthesis